jgi:nucleosome binding factor SPN SPT16 subunit
MGAPAMDEVACARRMKKMYAEWREMRETRFNGATALLVGTGANKEDDLRYLKAVALEVWLFSYELPDTLLMFTDGAIHVVAGGKKAALMENAKEMLKRECGLDLVVYVKPKGEDGTAQAKEILNAIEAEKLVVGMVPKEKNEGTMMTSVTAALEAAGTEIKDISSGLAHAMAEKDDKEVTTLKNAVALVSKGLSFAVREMEGAIEDEKKLTHAKLSEMTEDAVLSPTTLGLKFDEGDCDICYPPIIQSGGEYDLRYSAESSAAKLHYASPPAVVHMSIGARYTQYCANIGRTYMVDPTPAQEATYSAVLAAQEAGLAALVDGATCASVYEAVKTALTNAEGVDGAMLASKLTKNVGTGIGLEFRDMTFVLNAKCENVIKAGMTFNLAVGLQGLEEPSAKEGSKSRKYAIMIADSALVSAGGEKPTVLTTNAKGVKEISYVTNEDDEEEEEDDANVEIKQGGVILGAKTRLEQSGPSSAEDRERRQRALADKKNAETYKRLTQAADDEINNSVIGGSAEFVSYKTVRDVPTPRSNELVLAVDQDRETLLVPIYGQLVPFHIMSVKSASVSQDAGAAFIRINFQFPTTGAANLKYAPAVRFPNSIFLKEVSFRSTDARHANHVVQEIQALRRNIMQRETERAQRADLVRQERLVLSSGRVHRLTGLWMLPTFGGRGGRKAGTLEAHTNGMRYVGAKMDEQVDIMYENIRFAFFQPAKQELKTLIHFHLKNPIMVGKKKTQDVQFYQEVMESVQNLDGGRRNMYDPDEIEDEQRERERQKKIQKEFSHFAKRVQEIWEKDFPHLNLEFDSPYHQLAFQGVAFKSTVRILPTATCLVELTEFPPLVISSSDIEVINLERVGFHLKNFDMAIIFRDFNREVHRIDQIPSQYLDNIKQWLTTLDVKYYEGKANLNWKPLLRQIKEDPDGWLEAGGWEFLNNEASDGEDEEDEEMSEFEPSEDEDESESEDDSESESVYDSEEDEGEEELDEDDEEGLSWDELEEKAAREDADVSDSDERPKKKKR